MAEYPYMPLATDAYLGDTKHLRTIEHGAYLLLLICAWRVPGTPRLPNSDRILARYAGVNMSTWRSMRDTVMGFWQLGEDGYWTQKKQLEVRAKAAKKVREQREKSLKRWGPKSLEDNDMADAAAMPDPMQPKPNLLLSKKNTPKPPEGARRSRTKQDQGYGDKSDPLYADFSANVWPKRWARPRNNPRDAFWAFVKLDPADRDACKAAIERTARQLEASVDDPKYRPMLSSWINRRGWEADNSSEAPRLVEGSNVWRTRLTAARERRQWASAKWGPTPGQPGCRVPPELLAKGDGEGWSEWQAA